MIIAVDGPAAAGKGTLSRILAEELGFAHLDTGQLYRAVAVLTDAPEDDPGFAEAAADAARRLRPADLARGDLRGELASQLSSKVAAIPAVRQALLAFQRDFARRPPGGEAGAVLDGRDIGTVVCPEAEVKLFVTASLEERARRRHKELLDRGEESIYARVLQDMGVRDARDSTRATAPLRPAEDAVVLDTTALGIEAVLQAAMKIVKERQRLPGAGAPRPLL